MWILFLIKMIFTRIPPFRIWIRQSLSGSTSNFSDQYCLVKGSDLDLDQSLKSGKWVGLRFVHMFAKSRCSFLPSLACKLERYLHVSTLGCRALDVTCPAVANTLDTALRIHGKTGAEILAFAGTDKCLIAT